MASWIKAGLIGGVVLSALHVLNVLFNYIAPPGVVALACCCGTMLAYLLACGGTGALAAQWLPAPRNSGTAAGQGAMAGGLAGLIGGAVNAAAMLIESAVVDPATVVSRFSPETLNLLKDLGITTEMIESSSGPISRLIGGACCCGVGVIVALALGAIGGAIWAAIRPQESALE